MSCSGLTWITYSEGYHKITCNHLPGWNLLLLLSQPGNCNSSSGYLLVLRLRDCTCVAAAPLKLTPNLFFTSIFPTNSVDLKQE